jgi:hypothetical protein
MQLRAVAVPVLLLLLCVHLLLILTGQASGRCALEPVLLNFISTRACQSSELLFLQYLAGKSRPGVLTRSQLTLQSWSFYY